MTTTVWQGTIEAGPVVADQCGNTIDNVQVTFGFPHGSSFQEGVTVDNYVVTAPATGYCEVTGLDNGPVVLESKSYSSQTGTDFNTAWSNADSTPAPLLFLDPTKTYTLTITTED